MGERVELVVDPRRGERVTVDLPISFRVPPDAARRSMGLPGSVDLGDPIVAKAVALLDAARRATPTVPLAVLGGVAYRLSCPSSNRTDFGLRRPLHDLDIACLHREIRRVREMLVTLHELEGSGLQFFETAGDRIFNSLGEGQRFRYHMLLGAEDRRVSLGTVDLLADEFRFCHRLDLRSDVVEATSRGGTLSPALLLLTKLQYIRQIPEEDREKVPDRVLAPFGRHDAVIGPETKDVQDVVALLLDHPFEESPSGLSLRRIAGVVAGDWGLWRTVTLNVEMVRHSPTLAALPPGVREEVAARLGTLGEFLAALTPKRRLGFLGGPWWDEVDAQPSVDGTVEVG
ncbi:MAG: hypothetical protein ACRECT_01490 [Thermoplasmata archaeon]